MPSHPPELIALAARLKITPDALATLRAQADATSDALVAHEVRTTRAPLGDGTVVLYDLVRDGATVGTIAVTRYDDTRAQQWSARIRSTTRRPGRCVLGFDDGVSTDCYYQGSGRPAPRRGARWDFALAALRAVGLRAVADRTEVSQ